MVSNKINDINKNKLHERLSNLLQQANVMLLESQKKQLISYVGLLEKWNKAYNLTSIVDPNEMLVKHILDSVVVSRHLYGQRLVDVGTGAGLPGIPLAIINPDKKFYLLDSLGKRIRFLTQVVHTLGLKNVILIQSRVENYQSDEKFDIVLSRAFASVIDMITWCKHLLRKPSLEDEGGAFFALKGIYPQSELDNLPNWCTLKQAIQLKVPQLKAERNLVILQHK